MYLQCILINCYQSQADVQIEKIKQSKRGSSYIQTKQYKEKIRLNKTLIDSVLTEKSRQSNKELKNKIKMAGKEIVLVSPLRRALETCLDIYGDSEQVEIFVQPLLADRIDSIQNIPSSTEEIYKKFKKMPKIDKVEKNQWFLKFGNSSETIQTNLEEQGIKRLRNNPVLQQLGQFYDRLKTFRKQLINYIGKQKKKIVIISHQAVLQSLTSTGFHQDYTLVNRVQFDFGEVKDEYIYIEDINGEIQQNNIPFCT